MSSIPLKLQLFNNIFNNFLFFTLCTKEKFVFCVDLLSIFCTNFIRRFIVFCIKFMNFLNVVVIFLSTQYIEMFIITLNLPLPLCELYLRKGESVFLKLLWGAPYRQEAVAKIHASKKANTKGDVKKSAECIKWHRIRGFTGE